MLSFESSEEGCASVTEIARREFLLRAGRVLAGLVGVALIAGGSLRGYGIWRNHHLERQVTQFAASGDSASAVLAARQLLALQPTNLVALHAMAELAERAGSLEAIEWRKAITALRPNDPEAQLALAKTALRFHKRNLAGRVLDSVDEGTRATSLFHELAGALALARADLPAAEKHFAQAARREPANDNLDFNFAVVRLASPNAETREAAGADLRKLAEHPAMRITALRALAADALTHHDVAAAEKSTTALVAENAPPFSDLLLHLEATQMSTDALARCEREAAAKSDEAAQLITWLNRHDRAARAFAWGNELAPAVRENQPMPLALAESLSCLRQWQQLAQFVHGKDWKDAEPLRMAVESHAVRHLTSDPASRAEADTLWRNALRAGQGHGEQLIAIAQLAEGWGYVAQSQEAWWTVANGSTNAREALIALNRIYKAARDSRGLLRVAKRALELNPDDVVAANNAASLGLLLNGDAASHHLAEKLRQDHPNDAIVAATYAFSLHLQGKTADALRVIERLKEGELRQPALAAYYVMMLAESGNIEKARTFLSLAQHASLLPEEQLLLSNATRKLNASS